MSDQTLPDAKEEKSPMNSDTPNGNLDTAVVFIDPQNDVLSEKPR
jgi:hypothetical protein